MSHMYMDDKKINVNLNVVEGHREKKTAGQIEFYLLKNYLLRRKSKYLCKAIGWMSSCTDVYRKYTLSDIFSLNNDLCL